MLLPCFHYSWIALRPHSQGRHSPRVRPRHYQVRPCTLLHCPRCNHLEPSHLVLFRSLDRRALLLEYHSTERLLLARCSRQDRRVRSSHHLRERLGSCLHLSQVHGNLRFRLHPYLLEACQLFHLRQGGHLHHLRFHPCPCPLRFQCQPSRLHHHRYYPLLTRR